MIQLLFPRWQKKNKRFDGLSWAIAFALAIAVGAAFQSLGTEEQGAIAMIVCSVSRLILSFILNRFFTDSIIGSVRLNYSEIDWEFRKLFKVDVIHFHKRTENDTYRYEFPDYKLSVTLQDRSVTRRAKTRPITQAKFYPLNDQNKTFANRLTNVIDEMADQRPTSETENPTA